MPEETPEEYTTTDLYTTAVLLLHEFTIIQIRREGNGRKTKRFVFEDTPELRSCILSYFNAKMVGNLRDFRNSIETVKDMVHSG